MLMMRPVRRTRSVAHLLSATGRCTRIGAGLVTESLELVGSSQVDASHIRKNTVWYAPQLVREFPVALHLHTLGVTLGVRRFNMAICSARRGALCQTVPLRTYEASVKVVAALGTLFANVVKFLASEALSATVQVSSAMELPFASEAFSTPAPALNQCVVRREIDLLTRLTVLIGNGPYQGVCGRACEVIFHRHRWLGLRASCGVEVD